MGLDLKRLEWFLDYKKSMTLDINWESGTLVGFALILILLKNYLNLENGREIMIFNYLIKVWDLIWK